MEKLNLPTYNFKIKTVGDIKQIFDPVRKKYIVLTPEEWVRQNFIQYLVNECNFPLSLISVENGLKYFSINKRSDITAYNTKGEPHLIVECKAPHVKISQNVFNQISLYNKSVIVKCLIVTNGISHYCCLLDEKENEYKFINYIPDYKDL